MVIQAGATEDDEYDFAIMCFMVGPKGRARFAALWKEQVNNTSSAHLGEPLIIGGWPEEFVYNPIGPTNEIKTPAPAARDLIVIEHRGPRPASQAGRVWWHLSSTANEFLAKLKTDTWLIWSATTLAAALMWSLAFIRDGSVIAAGAHTPGPLLVATILLWMPVALSLLSGACMYASILAELNYVSRGLRFER